MSSNNKKRISAAKDTKGTVKRLLGYLPQQLLTPQYLSRI